MKLILIWVIQNTLTLVLCYLWLFEHMTWVGNIFSFYVWVMFLFICFVGIIYAIIKIANLDEPKFEKALFRTVPKWLSTTIDSIILIGLVVYGHFILATIWLIQIIIENIILKKKEKVNKKSEVGYDPPPIHPPPFKSS